MARQASATLTGSRGSEGRISGYVLKVIRESLGHTQERLAERLGVSAQPSKARKVAAVR
jgi:DNA-binding transcriptional regulator YiaG